MELRDRIIEEASNLFFRNGIKSISMSDIVQQLGISKRTLYENFRDKEELLEECIIRNLNRSDCEISILLKNSDNVIDALMQIYAKNLSEIQNINKSVIYDLKKYHPRLYKLIDCKQKDGVDFFLPLFEKGVSQGLIRDDINFEVLLWLLKAQFKMLMEEDFIPIDKFRLEDFAEAIILNFSRGIATPTGNKKIDESVKKIKNNQERK